MKFQLISKKIIAREQCRPFGWMRSSLGDELSIFWVNYMVSILLCRRNTTTHLLMIEELFHAHKIQFFQYNKYIFMFSGWNLCKSEWCFTHDWLMYEWMTWNSMTLDKAMRGDEMCVFPINLSHEIDGKSDEWEKKP